MSSTLYLSNDAGSCSFAMTLKHGRETARDVLHQLTRDQLVWLKVPREYAALVRWNAEQRWTHADIIRPETEIDQLQRDGRTYKFAVIDKRQCAPPTIDADWLTWRLPHIGESTRHKLLERLLTFGGQLDLCSIREQPSEWSASTAGASGMYGKIAIFSLNPIMPHVGIAFEGEELFPYRLLPGGGGVEFRSGYTYEYRAVTEEARLAHVDLAARLAHCKKLLLDLPIALANSRSAMKAHGESEQVDLNTLGAIALEQLRIEREIADQQARLPRLEQQIRDSTVNPSLHQYQMTLTLPLGTAVVDGRQYRLQKANPADQNAAASSTRTPTMLKLK